MLKNIFIKTSIKTLAVTLSLLIAVFSMGVIFAPSALAGAAREMGLSNLAASFKIIEYNRNKDINDLADVLELSIVGGKDSRILKYSELLIKHTKFKDFCSFKDENKQSSLITGSYEHYIYGRYSAALYKRGQADKAFELSKKLISHDNYPPSNAMQHLIMAVKEKGDVEMAARIRIHLSELAMDAANGNGETDLIKSRLNSHITILEEIR